LKSYTNGNVQSVLARAAKSESCCRYSVNTGAERERRRHNNQESRSWWGY